MLNNARFGLVALAMVALSGCAVKDGWQGAGAEKAYDKELEIKRLAEDLNNDDYWEIHKAEEGRIYAFSDLKDYQIWLGTNEIPLVVTKIGAGPNGETVKLQLSKNDSKAMEKQVGYKGPTEKMYSGELPGLEKGFYAEVHKDERVFVFESGKDLQEFKGSGEVPCGITQVGAGPGGKTVIFAQNCKAAAKGKPEAAMAKFASINAAK